tara:strand:+ start:486 stop:1121 length:636 start_codon:yes stop_codon:yes gene_type:complete
MWAVLAIALLPLPLPTPCTPSLRLAAHRRAAPPLLLARRAPVSDGRRSARVAQVVQSELAQVLHAGDIKGKRLDYAIRSMISIVEVDVSPDLRNAKVKVSVHGDRKDKVSATRWLTDQRGGIRHALAQRMKEFKRLPHLSFQHVDVGQAVDVMVLIDKLAKERAERGGDEEEGGLDFDADDDEAFAEYEEDWDDEEDDDEVFDDDDFDEDE